MTTALALTQGDPAGIGPEITLRAWLAREEHGLAPFFVIGDPDFLSKIAARLGLAVPLAEATPENAAQAFARALPVVRLPGNLTVAAEPGTPDPASAAGTLASIDEAVRLVRAGRAPAAAG